MGFSDASWSAVNPFYGYVMFMSNAPISFVSKTLKSAASSAEAEYAAAYEAAREIIFIRNLCEDLGFTLHGDLLIGVDNTAAIDIAYNVGTTARNKHFLRIFHMLRDEVLYGRLTMKFVPTAEQRADIFTKALGAADYTRNKAWLVH